MTTKLAYLGEHSSITKVSDAYRIASANYAFGWSRIDYPGSEGQRVMVAWVPGYYGQEYGVWPVYGGDQPKRDLGSVTQWSWDGSLESPTLQPSIHHINHYPKAGKGDVTIAHGFVREGCWESA